MWHLIWPWWQVNVCDDVGVLVCQGGRAGSRGRSVCRREGAGRAAGRARGRVATGAPQTSTATVRGPLTRRPPVHCHSATVRPPPVHRQSRIARHATYHCHSATVRPPPVHRQSRIARHAGYLCTAYIFRAFGWWLDAILNIDRILLKNYNNDNVIRLMTYCMVLHNHIRTNHRIIYVSHIIKKVWKTGWKKRMKDKSETKS